MSLSEELLAKYPTALKRYLDAAGPAMAIMGPDLRLLAANRRFADMVGWESGAPEGSLDDFAEFMGGKRLPLPPPGQGWNVNLVLKRAGGTSSQKTFFIASEQGAYLLFASEASNADDAFMGEVSRLNAELTDLARELRKKQVALERANERISNLARTDSMTGLANRRFFHEQLTRALASARRHGLPLALAMADIDRFKSVNDDFGHPAGDQALKAFAALLASETRQEDLPARWGGEEFVLMMPNTDGTQGCDLAERIRLRFSRTGCPAVPRAMTASFGVASFAPGDDEESLIARADEALYRAKREGRDRVVLA